MARRLHRSAIEAGRLTVRTAFLLVFSALFVVGCGSSAEPTDSSGRLPNTGPAPTLEVLTKKSIASDTRNLVAVRWKLSGSPRGRQVAIYAQRGYCVGEAPPEFKGVRVVESGDRVFITAYMNRPAAPEQAVCGGIGGFLRGTVEIRQAADDARLYDASTAPPSKRWPKHRIVSEP